MQFDFVKKTIVGFFVLILAVYFWEVYSPRSFSKYEQAEVYEVIKGSGVRIIAADLQRAGIIKNRRFFILHTLIAGDFRKLQAGKYRLSPSMSIAEIIGKMADGDSEKTKITIIEGWSIKDIGEYLEKNNYYLKKEFLDLTKKDWGGEFSFLKDKSNEMTIEGYIFPDTYEISLELSAEDLARKALANFNKKLTKELKEEILRQGKSVFEIVTMASMIEKEVKSFEDKKIVSGILWKRLENGMPLQIDATINYITGKKDSRAKIDDTKIDSPYNTYKYAGLPIGPISNPGMDSILAAIYPIETDYWYYLSADGNGETIFSKTLEEHNQSAANYLSFQSFTDDSL